MTARELYALLQLRVDVFVVEQACPYRELDGRDAEALHLVARAGSDLAGTLRLFLPAGPGQAAQIGRVAVHPELRGRGLAGAMMRNALQTCARLAPGAPVDLAAQAHLTPFYAAFGFAAAGTPYTEDGIPHLDMRRPPPTQGAA